MLKLRPVTSATLLKNNKLNLDEVPGTWENQVRVLDYGRIDDYAVEAVEARAGARGVCDEQNKIFNRRD